MGMKYFALLLGILASCRQESDEASRSVIDGVWETACITAADQTSLQVRYSFFANNSAQRLVNYYADAACAVPRGTLSHLGNFELAVRTDASFYEIDLFFREVVGIPSDETGAAAWNAQSFCGITRWLAREAEDVIAQSDPACGVYGVSRIEYRDVIDLDPDRSLTFGTRLNSNDPRPASPDGQNPLNVFRFIRH